MRNCKSCNDFRFIYLPEMVWEKNTDGVEQARWVYRKVKCAACFVQTEMRI